MGDIGIVAALVVLGAVIVVVALRLRRTTEIGGRVNSSRVGGSVRLTDSSGNKLSIDKLLENELAASGSAKPVFTISTVTRQGVSGSPTSSETITIDGETYHSVDEIPAEVRDRVRALLVKAAAKGGKPELGGAAMARLGDELAALGLDLREPERSLDERREEP